MTIRGELDVHQVNLQRVADVLRLRIEVLQKQVEALVKRIERLENQKATTRQVEPVEERPS